MTAAADTPSLASLLAAARRPYSQAIRKALDTAGMDDVPPRGAVLIAGLDRSGTPMRELPATLGVSKQAVSQLIDTLADRGYLTRAADPNDRRRMVLTLTARGREAAKVSRRAVATVDRKLAQRVGPTAMNATRRVLGELSRW